MHKPLRTTFLLTTLLVSTAACTNFTQTIEDSNYVVDAMASGTPLAALRSIPLSEAQQHRIEAALAQYEQFRHKWNEIHSTNPQSLPSLATEFQRDYSELKRHFLLLEADATGNWPRYSEPNKAILKEFLRHSRSIDAEVSAYYANRRYIEAAKTALILASNLLRVLI